MRQIWTRRASLATGLLATTLVLSGLLVPPAAAPGAGLGGASAAAATTATTTAERAGARPNIVVVMADDMRADELRFMPRLMRVIRREGLRYENSFANYPLCCPARASFLTGRYAHNHRVYWHEAPWGYGAFDDSRTLATSLKGAGYRTGFVGKYLNGYGTQRSKVSGRPSHRYVPNGWDDWRAAVENPGGLGFRGGTYNYMNTAFNANGRIDDSHDGEYQSGVIGGISAGMAGRFAGRRPFFMYVNYVAPHFGGPNEPDDVNYVADNRGNVHDVRTPARPRWVRGRFNDLIRRSIGLPRRGPSEADVSDKPRPFARFPEPNARERRVLRDLTRQRAESIYVMDHNISRLIGQLKRSGEWRKTVFVFTSDNGYYLGEHRKRSGKVTAHEPSFRVPLLVTGPGMREGERRYDPVTTVDLTRTVLDFAGARPPRAPDGRSVRGSMIRGDQGWPRPVLYEATNTGAAKARSVGFTDRRTSIGIRTARYSYVRHRQGRHELYDLRKDPHQLRNLWRADEYRWIKRDLTKVWWATKDCRAQGCRSVALPARLTGSSDWVAAVTRAWWGRHFRRHGY